MKASYKLFGNVWDRQKIPEKCPIVQSVEQDVKGTPIKLSVLIAEENPRIEPLNENMLMDIDFIPRTSSAVVWDFYIKRLLQIIEHYQTKIVCSNLSDCGRLNVAIENFYKRKTPERLLAQSDGALQMIC